MRKGTVMEFVAIDVETANADMASICQIGLAKFKDGQLVEEWSSFIDPEDYFDFIKIGVKSAVDSYCSWRSEARVKGRLDPLLVVQ